MPDLPKQPQKNPEQPPKIRKNAKHMYSSLKPSIPEGKRVQPVLREIENYNIQIQLIIPCSFLLLMKRDVAMQMAGSHLRGIPKYLHWHVMRGSALGSTGQASASVHNG
jgi:hypothetical protein